MLTDHWGVPSKDPRLLLLSFFGSSVHLSTHPSCSLLVFLFQGYSLLGPCDISLGGPVVLSQRGGDWKGVLSTSGGGFPAAKYQQEGLCLVQRLVILVLGRTFRKTQIGLAWGTGRSVSPWGDQDHRRPLSSRLPGRWHPAWAQSAKDRYSMLRSSKDLQVMWLFFRTEKISRGLPSS